MSRPFPPRFRAGLPWLLAALLAGCDKPAPAATAPALPPDAVARVGTTVITAGAFTNALARAGASAVKERVLDDLVREAALLEKARAAGFDRDPAVVAAVTKLVAARFEEQQLEARLKEARNIPEAELKAAYEAGASKQAIPPRLRAGVLHVRTSPKATAEKRAEARRRAESIQAQAAATNGTGFVRLVQQHSDDQATRYTGGDSGWIAADGTANRWDPAVMKALLSLSATGQVTSVIETTNGFYVGRLIETQAGGRKSFADVADGLRYQLARQREQKAREDFLEGVKREFPAEVNRAVLDAIPAPAAAAPPRPPARDNGR